MTDILPNFQTEYADEFVASLCPSHGGSDPIDAWVVLDSLACAGLQFVPSLYATAFSEYSEDLVEELAVSGDFGVTSWDVGTALANAGLVIAPMRSDRNDASEAILSAP